MKKLSKLEQIAFNIACEAPLKPSSPTVQVYRGNIQELRDELTRLGWDWQKYAKIHRENIDKARKAWVSEHTSNGGK